MNGAIREVEDGRLLTSCELPGEAWRDGVITLLRFVGDRNIGETQ